MELPKLVDEQYMDTLEKTGILGEIPWIRHQVVIKELRLRSKKYAEEEIIFSEEEEIKSLAILHRGTVRGEKFHLEGNVDLMHMYQPGEIFGTEAAASRMKTSPLTYIANEPVTVLFIDFLDILRGNYSTELMLALMHILADNNIKNLYKIEALSKRGLRDRIMTYLRIISKKAASNSFSIHMDREQMAQYLCVNRSALSYELNQMKREGLVDFKKDKFKIL